MERILVNTMGTALIRDGAESRPGCRLLSIATWSLVSLPCFWIPFYFDHRYAESVDDSRLGLVVVFGAPFLAIATFMCVRACVGLWRTLQRFPRNRRYALGLIGAALAGLSVVPAGYMAFYFVIVLFWGLWTTFSATA
jgi:hypothetical protein